LSYPQADQKSTTAPRALAVSKFTVFCVERSVMGWPAIVDSWLADQQRLQTESYIKRGRTLAAISTHELKWKWIKEFRVWAQSAGRPHLPMNDIQAELTIRGEASPFDKVEAEWQAQRERSRAEQRSRLRRDLINSQFHQPAPPSNGAGFQYLARPNG
jgi:hypothetical protein